MTNVTLDGFNKGVDLGIGIVLILVNFLYANLCKEITAREFLFKEE